jgi:23S rRNA (adenine-N6)-dimethyltransferase
MASPNESTLWRTQNFLRRPALARALVRRAALRPEDVVYEIGAGAGAITEALARQVRGVVAIEKDPRLCAFLLRRFAGRANVDVRCADFLQHPLPRAPYKVFASPPFDITAAIVAKLTAAPVPPDDVFLIVQRQAAERYTGRPRETLAALMLKPFFEPTIVRGLRRDDFSPAPRVDVVMLRLRKRGPPLLAARDARQYRDLVAGVFTMWTPSIGASLRRSLGTHAARQLLHGIGIDPASRPSAVAFDEWLWLFRRFAALPPEIRARVAGADARLARQQRRVRKRHRSRVPRDRLDGLPGQPHAPASRGHQSLARERRHQAAHARVADGAFELDQRQARAPA